MSHTHPDLGKLNQQIGVQLFPRSRVRVPPAPQRNQPLEEPAWCWSWCESVSIRAVAGSGRKKRRRGEFEALPNGCL